MQQLFAHNFFESLKLLLVARNEIFKDSPNPINDVQVSYLKTTLLGLKKQSERFGLAFRAVTKELDHALQMLQFGPITPVVGHKVTASIDAIDRQTGEALQSGVVLFLEAEKARWHNALTPETNYPNDKPRWERRQIDPNVRTAFMSAVPDLEAAGNCYATDNDTASVFHLMRAVEHGLRAFAVAVGTPVGKLPFDYESWENLINDANKEWVKTVDTWGKSAEQINARRFFKRIVADLTAFKDDVRNVTMHTRGDYDANGAMSVRNRVDEWFVVLASKSHDNMTLGELLDRSLFAP
jgi:hypothetical protein